MKKRTLFLTLTLTMAMSVTSLTGCGTQAKATYDENAIVEETPTTEEDTMKEEVVVAGEDDTSTTKDTSNVENDIIQFDNSSAVPEYILSDMEFEANTRELNEKYGFTDKHIVQSFEATKEVPVYSEEGIRVGNIKNGATIELSEHGINTNWYRFKNPVSGTDYEYLYVNQDDIPVSVDAVFTQDEILQAIQKRFSNKDMSYELLDAPTDDMQKAEFSVSKTETIADSIVDSYLYAELHLSDYTKFYIEENGEDGENYNFVIYYKDLYQAE